ncbi:MAG: hypothetical protein KAX49_11890 [Halanaerobiales bacterium]|nr:hypothetical protein [Halanaerobiales bacterium]
MKVDQVLQYYLGKLRLIILPVFQIVEQDAIFYNSEKLDAVMNTIDAMTVAKALTVVSKELL